jgi:DNA polymerase-1
MERQGSAHGHISVWQVFDQNDDLPPPPGAGPDIPHPDDDPPPWNEHAVARGAAPEDLDGEGHDEVRGPDWDGKLGCSLHGGVALGTADGDTHWIDCAPNVCGHEADVRPDPRTMIPNVPDSEVSTMVPAGEITFEIEDVDSRTMVLITGEPVGVVTFDLETGDADDLYRTPGEEYVRIGATATDDRPVKAYDQDAAWNVANDVLQAGRFREGTITGHNIMAFDFPALVRGRVLSMEDVHDLAAEGRVFDGLLAARYLDPPMARDKGVDATRKYDLGTLAVTKGLGEKYTDLSKPLAAKYGGWGEIPIDLADPDEERAADARSFQDYMVQDVELSRRLHATLLEELGGTVPEYLRREHRVAALAAQIRHNGFLVDQELLTERVTEVNERKAQALGWLHDNAGIPLADAKGKAYKSPLATKLGKQALEAAFKMAGATSFWRTGVSGDFAVSADHMRHLAAEYHHLPQVREIAKNVYRIVGARSVYQTALDHLMPDGRVHPKIGFEQATGRWSVTRPGLTVFGKRGGRHVERDVFLPDPGQVLISVDLSQVDMRAVAGLSQDQAYIEMLKTDDPHTELAVALFGDGKFRETAKAIGHGWNYGESLKRISMENEIDPAVVNRFDRSMYERFGRLVEWREEVRAQAGSGLLLDNGFGRLMRADPLRAHTQGPALMGQGAARDLMMTGLLRLPPEVRPMLRAQIHDEVVASVPEADAAEIGRVIVDAFTFEWRGVPILADVSKAGKTWGACYAKG